MNKQQLLKRLEKAWEVLKDSYAGLPDYELLQPGVIGNWSVRDIVAHITWWEEEALKHLPVILKGGRPPRYSTLYGGIDAFNALMTAQRKDLSLSEVWLRRDETHQRLIDFIQRVPEDQCYQETRFRRRLRLDTYGHYAEHTKAIQSWRGEREL